MKKSSIFKRREGIALVIVLSMIVLMTAVTVAFFVKTQGHRMVEASGAARVRSEILARSGVDYVSSLLTHEMTTASDVIATQGSTSVLFPKTRSDMVAKEHFKPKLADSKASHMPAILKQSITAFTPDASKVAAATPNKQGRYIYPPRWSDSDIYFALNQFTSDYNTPDWIYFDEDGPTTTPGPTIQGRLAFNIFQVDNLLDFSVAGYPVALASDIYAVNALKGSMAGADITKLGRQPVVYKDPTNMFVDVRSRASVTKGDYVAKILADHSGLTEPIEGDTKFFNRTDLVRFAVSNGLNNNPLGYMTPWSRAVDAPSWKPTVGTAANVFSPAVFRTVTASITDYFLDGTTRVRQALENTPVVSRRFPLNRIQWFGSSLNVWPTAIRQYFGLTLNASGYWEYIEPAIRTQDELKGLTREPNFFEMLKAAIVTGSLGFHSGTGFGAMTEALDKDVDLHILKIGANIIDAARVGNEPSVLCFKNGDGTYRYAIGKKDLPYLYSIRFSQIVHVDQYKKLQQVDYVALPIFVNPHALPAGDAPPGSTGKPPIRLRMVGLVEDAMTRINDTDVPLTAVGSAVNQVMDVSSTGFDRPSPPIHSGTGAFPDPMPGYYTGSYRGFWLATGPVGGTFDAKKAEEGKATLRGVNFILEYRNSKGVWIPYDALIGDGFNGPALGLGDSVPVDVGTPSGTSDDDSYFGTSTGYFVKPDPRTSRGGVAYGKVSSAKASTLNNHFIPGTQVSTFYHVFYPQRDVPYAADPDGTLRPDDLRIGSYGENKRKYMINGLGNYLMKDGAALTDLPNEDRNRMLHRPYRTVAEMGVVFRDQPWKTLNFATMAPKFWDGTNDIPVSNPASMSGDYALLDYFTISEQNEKGLVAGRLNLNTGELASQLIDNQLQGTSLLVGRAGETIDEPAAGILRYQFIDAMGQTAKLYSVAEMPGTIKFAAFEAASYKGPKFTSSKQGLEAFARAVGTAGQVRTWVVFVDVISQVGRLTPSGSSDLEKDFTIQGEFRYWAHLAIDRFTGRVVDSQIEAYQE